MIITSPFDIHFSKYVSCSWLTSGSIWQCGVYFIPLILGYCVHIINVWKTWTWMSFALLTPCICCVFIQQYTSCLFSTCWYHSFPFHVCQETFFFNLLSEMSYYILWIFFFLMALIIVRAKVSWTFLPTPSGLGCVSLAIEVTVNPLIPRFCDCFSCNSFPINVCYP